MEVYFVSWPIFFYNFRATKYGDRFFFSCYEAKTLKGPSGLIT